MPHEPTPDQEMLRSFVYAFGGLIFAIVIFWLATGCSSAWPKRCETDIRSGVTCDCRPGGLRVIHHTVSGTATLHCNGEPLPIDVDERGEP